MYNEYTPERVTKLKAIEGNVSIKRTKPTLNDRLIINHGKNKERGL